MAPSFPKPSLLWGMSYDELSELDAMIHEALYLMRNYPDRDPDCYLNRDARARFHRECEAFCEKYHGKLAFEHVIRYGCGWGTVTTGLLASVNDYIARRFKKEVDTVHGHPVVLAIRNPETGKVRTKVYRVKSGAFESQPYLREVLQKVAFRFLHQNRERLDIRFGDLDAIPVDVVRECGLVEADDDVPVVWVNSTDSVVRW